MKKEKKKKLTSGMSSSAYQYPQLALNQRNTVGQQEQLPPVIKRIVPEGHDYRIVIPENVEHIIRKFCDKAPRNEWSGTLFYEIEGDFDSASFKIICKDFFLMDLGSGAYTEFDEDGTAIDYMVQHPELLNCQMGLLHSHDTMPTFFSGTDTNTLRSEGNDRNNFVSLIVNNEGTYSAAITRKVEYTEKHDITLSGKYPFFGTKRVLQTPSSHSVEEKKKTIIEYFELTVEKVSVEFHPDEYDTRFNEVAMRKVSKTSPYATPSTTRYPSLVRTFHDNDDFYDDDFDYPRYGKPFQDSEPKKADDDKIIDSIKGTVFKDEETFEPEFVREALTTPVLEYKFKELILQVLTGCPIITQWVRSYEINNKTFEDAIAAFKTRNISPTLYAGFVSSYLENLFILHDAEDFFPKLVTDREDAAYVLENIIIIKLINAMYDLEQSDHITAVIAALKDFYSL